MKFDKNDLEQISKLKNIDVDEFKKSLLEKVNKFVSSEIKKTTTHQIIILHHVTLSKKLNILMNTFFNYGFEPKRERVLEILIGNTNFNYDYFCYVLNDGENQKDLTKETFNRIKGEFSIELYKAVSTKKTDVETPKVKTDVETPKVKSITVKSKTFDLIENLLGEIFTRKELVSCFLIANKKINSLEEYDWKSHRGYYSCAISKYLGNGYLYAGGRDGRYLQKVSKGIYELRGNKK